jgi:hypothetical protein
MDRHRFERFPPPPHLSVQIAEIHVQESSGPVNQRVLPELGLVLGFQFRGRMSLVSPSGKEQFLASHGITGFHEDPRTFRSPGALGSVLVRLEPWASRQFLGVPAAEITGLSLGLDEFVPRTALETVSGELHQAASDEVRLAARQFGDQP